MCRKQIGSIFLQALIFSFAIPTAAQQTDDEESRRVVIGFMQAREKTSGKPSTQKTSPGHKETQSPDVKGGKNSHPDPTPTINHQMHSGGKDSEEPLGFGLTFFQRDPNGIARRIPFSKVFHSGDATRLVIEPNVNGYLYIFHTENNGPAEMIYPNPKLRGGSNYVEAHRSYEVPSREEQQFQWFEFFDPPATEHLYVVLSRETLPGVPTGSILESFCANNNPRCVWKVSQAAWHQITSALTTPVRTGFSRAFGQEETSDESEAVSRGYGLPPAAPAPSFIYLCKKTDAKVFVRHVEIIHK